MSPWVHRTAAAILAASFAMPAAAGTPQQIDVMLSSYAFTPSSLQFRAGKAYRLHLVNTSGKGHSFEAKDFFAAVAVAPQDRAKIDDGNVEVDEGQTVDIDFVPQKSGKYDFDCAHFLHAGFGMKGVAEILP